MIKDMNFSEWYKGLTDEQKEGLCLLIQANLVEREAFRKLGVDYSKANILHPSLIH